MMLQVMNNELAGFIAIDFFTNVYNSGSVDKSLKLHLKNKLNF